MSNDTCSMPECHRRVYGRGWCAMHYKRWYKHGDPTVTRPPGFSAADPAILLAAKISQPDSQGCTLWNGYVNEDGYGQFKLRGKMMGAHRAAYILAVGEIPDGLDLDHLCHTRDSGCKGGVNCKHRRCVSVSHLEPVTPAENTRRGRGAWSAKSRPTHCRNNHMFSPDNIYWYRGRRNCRICLRNKAQRNRAKKNA